VVTKTTTHNIYGIDPDHDCGGRTGDKFTPGNASIDGNAEHDRRANDKRHHGGMVFPLAMYTTATFQLSRATHFEFLLSIPRAFIFIALGAWLIAFGGLVHHLRSIVRAHIYAFDAEPRPM
jgi:hypothetical protein